MKIRENGHRNATQIDQDSKLTKNVRPINNSICAYRKCIAKPTLRLYFQLGFSALFCQKCAGILLSDRLATPEASEHEKQNYFDGLNDID